MTPSREERVEQVMPVRDSLLEAVPIVHDSRAGSAIYGCLVSTLHIASAILHTISPCALAERRPPRDRP